MKTKSLSAFLLNRIEANGFMIFILCYKNSSAFRLKKLQKFASKPPQNSSELVLTTYKGIFSSEAPFGMQVISMKFNLCHISS